MNIEIAVTVTYKERKTLTLKRDLFPSVQYVISSVDKLLHITLYYIFFSLRQLFCGVGEATPTQDQLTELSLNTIHQTHNNPSDNGDHLLIIFRQIFTKASVGGSRGR